MAELPKPEVDGICPHCRTTVRFSYPLKDSNHIKKIEIDYHEKSHRRRIVVSRCPSCNQTIWVKQVLIRDKTKEGPYDSGLRYKDEILIWPREITRKAPPEIPKAIAKDYEEAYAVLNISQTASALMARRCLQHILHNAPGVKKGSLDEEIKAIKNALPKDLQDKPELIKLLGRFAAHPKEDSKTGSVLDVEKDEAEFALTIIEYLFDHYYVKPARDKRLADKIRTKISRAKS